ncbi:MAG: hypothetical protein DRR16_08815 [Candidatus Parabeggiatoa sp. nov. 3]|nr:MAG: hypothetical protein DRR16_08815 [Gammaproteobacteria bacterium]
MKSVHLLSLYIYSIFLIITDFGDTRFKRANTQGQPLRAISFQIQVQKHTQKHRVLYDNIILNHRLILCGTLKTK